MSRSTAKLFVRVALVRSTYVASDASDNAIATVLAEPVIVKSPAPERSALGERDSTATRSTPVSE